MYNDGIKAMEGNLIISRQDGKDITPKQIDRLNDKIVDLVEANGFVMLTTLTLNEK